MSGAVVHVVVAGEVGGAERMLLDLVAHQDGRAHTIALATPNERLRDLFRDAGVVVDDRGPDVREGPLPFLRSTFGRSDVGWLASVLEKRRARIVHLHTFGSQVIGTRAAELVGARIVRTEHSTRVYDDPSCYPFARWSLPRADAVVFISEHVRRVAQRRMGAAVDPQTATVVHNGIDVERFAPRQSPHEEGKPVRFVALGRLDRRKGLDLALDALAQVPNAELDIVGEGDPLLRAELVGIAAKNRLGGRVRLHGYREDVRASIAEADVALSSAREEGLGIAVLEAMAMERPVCAVPVGGLVEIVRDGETGWMADVRTADALARAMRGAVEDFDERTRRGANGRRRVIESFSLGGMRKAYETVYARLDPASPASSVLRPG